MVKLVSWGILVLCSTSLLGQTTTDKKVLDSCNAEQLLEVAWSNVCMLEDDSTDRVTKFGHFLSALLGTKVPDDWGARGIPKWQDEFIALNEPISDSERIKISCEGFHRTVVMLMDSNEKIIWEIPPQDLFPRLVSGPATLRVKSVTKDQDIYLFGSLGPVMFVQGISKTNGNIKFHFAFDRTSNSGNLGRRVKRD